MAALVGDEKVDLITGGSDNRDRYDRLLRYVDVDGADTGLTLIEQGLAIARYDSRDGYGAHPREDAYIAADNATAHVCDTQTAPAPTQPPAEDVYYENCTAAREAGAAPVYEGDPGYGTHLDRDGDGIGCE